MVKNIYIIVGSARPHWLGRQIAKWVRSVGKRHTSAVLTIVDAEDFDVIKKDRSAKTRWVRGKPITNETYSLQDADGYIFIAPEYSKGTSEVLEQLLVELKRDIKQKPVAFVAYGQHGGGKLVEVLRAQVRRFNKAPMGASVNITQPWQVLDEEGQIVSHVHDKSLHRLMRQLAGWTNAPAAN